ncbi:hypothetical protein RTP6_004986 [Batrachochytrium dendrobatidis]
MSSVHVHHSNKEAEPETTTTTISQQLSLAAAYIDISPHLYIDSVGAKAAEEPSGVLLLSSHHPRVKSTDFCQSVASEIKDLSSVAGDHPEIYCLNHTSSNGLVMSNPNCLSNKDMPLNTSSQQTLHSGHTDAFTLSSQIMSTTDSSALSGPLIKDTEMDSVANKSRESITRVSRRANQRSTRSKTPRAAALIQNPSTVQSISATRADTSGTAASIALNAVEPLHNNFKTDTDEPLGDNTTLVSKTNNRDDEFDYIFGEDSDLSSIHSSFFGISSTGSVKDSKPASLTHSRPASPTEGAIDLSYVLSTKTHHSKSHTRLPSDMIEGSVSPVRNPTKKKSLPLISRKTPSTKIGTTPQSELKKSSRGSSRKAKQNIDHKADTIDLDCLSLFQTASTELHPVTDDLQPIAKSKRRLQRPKKPFALDIVVNDAVSSEPGSDAVDDANFDSTQVQQSTATNTMTPLRRARPVRTMGIPSLALPVNPFSEQEQLQSSRTAEEDLSLIRSSERATTPESTRVAPGLNRIEKKVNSGNTLQSLSGISSQTKNTILSSRTRRSTQTTVLDYFAAHPVDVSSAAIPLHAPATTVTSAPSNKRAANRYNHDNCSACLGTGELLCCDTCPRVFHLACVQEGFSGDDVPQGFWQCRRCAFLSTETTSTTFNLMPDGHMHSVSLKPSDVKLWQPTEASESPCSNLPFNGRNPDSSRKRKREGLMDPLLKVLDSLNPRVFELPAHIAVMYTDVMVHPATGEFIDLRTTKVDVVPASGRNSRGRVTKAASLRAESSAKCNSLNALNSPVVSTLTAAFPDTTLANPATTDISELDLKHITQPEFRATEAAPTLSSKLAGNISQSTNNKKNKRLTQSHCHGCRKTGMRLSQTSFLSSHSVHQPKHSGTNHLSLQTQRSELIYCDYCSLAWHLDCLTPPLSTIPPELRPSSEEIVDPTDWQRVKAIIWKGSPLNDLSYINTNDQFVTREQTSDDGFHLGEKPSDGEAERNSGNVTFVESMMEAMDPGLLTGAKHLIIRQKWMCPCHADWVLPKRVRVAQRIHVHVSPTQKDNGGIVIESGTSSRDSFSAALESAGLKADTTLCGDSIASKLSMDTTSFPSTQRSNLATPVHSSRVDSAAQDAQNTTDRPYTNMGHIHITNSMSTTDVFEAITTAKRAHDTRALRSLLAMDFHIPESRVTEDFVACIRHSQRRDKFQICSTVDAKGVLGEEIQVTDPELRNKFAEFDQTFCTNAREVYYEQKQKETKIDNRSTDSGVRQWLVGQMANDGTDLQSEDFLVAMALLQMDLVPQSK